MKYSCFFIGIFCTIITLTSCNNTDGVAPRNPNGESELALLMLEMFDDAMDMKGQIEKGKLPEVTKRFEKLHTAQATEPEKVATPIYTTFTNAYQESLDALKNSELGESPKAFNAMVQSCLNCHQAMCPGPIVKIEKLWVDTKQEVN